MLIRTTYRKDDGSGVIEIVLNDYEGLSTEIARYAEELNAIQPGLVDELFLKRWNKLDPQDKNAWRYMTSKNPVALGAETVARLLDQHEPGWRSTDIGLVRPLITSQQAAALGPRRLRSVRGRNWPIRPGPRSAKPPTGNDAFAGQDGKIYRPPDGGRKSAKAFQLVQKAETLERQRGSSAITARRSIMRSGSSA